MTLLLFVVRPASEIDAIGQEDMPKDSRSFEDSEFAFMT